MMIIPVAIGVVLLLLVGLFMMWFFSKSTPENASSASAIAASAGGLDLTAQTGIVLDAGADHLPLHGYYLARACDLAYYAEAEGAPKFRAELNLESRLVSVDNTQAWVCENEGSIVVAFRGSESPATIDGFKDWLLTNARNFLVLPEGRIGTDFAAAGVGARFHRGFMEALAEIWTPLHVAIEEALRRKERPLWVTGHSLGGAIAKLAAWRLHQKFIAVHRICTFGAPMTGNKLAADAFFREFPGRVVRYVDHCDMVPKLPTMSLLSNEYDHVQREIVLGVPGERSASTLLVNASAEDAEGAAGEVSVSVANSLWNELHAGISAHLMGNYISRISDSLS